MHFQSKFLLLFYPRNWIPGTFLGVKVFLRELWFACPQLGQRHGKIKQITLLTYQKCECWSILMCTAVFFLKMAANSIAMWYSTNMWCQCFKPRSNSSWAFRKYYPWSGTFLWGRAMAPDINLDTVFSGNTGRETKFLKSSCSGNRPIQAKSTYLGITELQVFFLFFLFSDLKWKRKKNFSDIRLQTLSLLCI